MGQNLRRILINMRYSRFTEAIAVMSGATANNTAGVTTKTDGKGALY